MGYNCSLQLLQAAALVSATASVVSAAEELEEADVAVAWGRGLRGLSDWDFEVEFHRILEWFNDFNGISWNIDHYWILLIYMYPLVMTNITMENGHRSSGFFHWTWWFSIVVYLSLLEGIWCLFLFVSMSLIFEIRIWWFGWFKRMMMNDSDMWESWALWKVVGYHSEWGDAACMMKN